jgi:hypothetical protein
MLLGQHLQQPLQALPVVQDLVRPTLNINVRLHTVDDVVAWATHVPRAHACQPS